MELILKYDAQKIPGPNMMTHSRETYILFVGIICHLHILLKIVIKHMYQAEWDMWE